MKITRLLPFAFVTLLFATSCSDSEPDTVVVPEVEVQTASKSGVKAFFKSDAYYQPYVYRYDSTTTKWTSRIASHFATIPTDTSAIGFTNANVIDSGVNLFGMVTLYAEALGSNNIKEARINAEKVLEFIPSEKGSKTGKVKVIPQDVVIRRKDGVANSTTNPATVKVGIKGEGTYDEATKMMDLTVIFNETEVGGKAAVYRKYKISVDPQTLN
ncbi:hypothetical protein DSL64_22815 [Dyadobacter luteus]|uniref:Uncharacterized protein n=1 Tax=Dyadobacter luteus TaxID=2259619 RepID=A0A3D8Y5I1_9BACT|nr:hypothetical protein [Dyadobacter luteus]REA57769.1 hypothetical protein DSL64_22815 [Dyadobacter luteus]